MVDLKAEERIGNYLNRMDDKRMIAIPLSVLLIAIGVLGATYWMTGSPVQLGYEFMGGTVVDFISDKSTDELLLEFSELEPVDARSFGERKLLEFPPLDTQHMDVLNTLLAGYEDVQIRQSSPLFGKTLQTQALKAVLFAFLGMAVVVFIIFRTFVPSVAVVLSAFSDITISIAIMDIVGVKLTLATVAALLMLIGYSVDSDILLTNRLLRRRGYINEKLVSAMKTGLTMTITSLFAIGMLFLVSSYSYIVSPSFSRIDILADIATVLLFGLSVDIMNTWMLNAAILRRYIGDKRRTR